MIIAVRIVICFLSLLCYFVSPQNLQAQAPKRMDSGQIHAAIQKAQVLGSALYMAAHPDDENTRLIAHFANVDKVETAYLSLTRGDGGQNLIAGDIRELLGLTRTQELLAARRIDGGSQFFSRANDFGYSKHPDETFNIWDKQKVLSDAVRVIRMWRPDVIVLRFDPRKPGTTHGHHTASAVIGMEAFEKAGDPAAFPEQIAAGLKPWQPKRIYWNAYTWRRDLADHIKWDQVIKVDAGSYLPVLGEGVAEIAARSRSQHKSQGFGSSGRRGSIMEDLELMAGPDKDAEGDPFADIDLSWNRVTGGKAIGEALATIEKDFQLGNPSASVPALLDVYAMIQKLPAQSDNFWQQKKATEVQEIIMQCLGIYAAAGTDEAMITAGDSLEIRVEVANRSQYPVELLAYNIYENDRESKQVAVAESSLKYGEVFKKKSSIKISDKAQNSGPYWLQKQGTLGMYEASDDKLIGYGESPDPVTAVFTFSIADRNGNKQQFLVRRPVRHQFTDPVKGEQHQPLEIMEAVFAELGESSYLFTASEASDIQVTVKANRAKLSGIVSLNAPKGWKVSPESMKFEMSRKGEEQLFTFQLTPPEGQSQGNIQPVVKLESESKSYSRKLVRIEHDHIPTQLASLDASAPVSKLDLKRYGQNIGYIMGAGDAIPEALRNVGYDVTLLGGDDIATGNLGHFDAIVVGIRAYNTEANMANYHPKLLQYVADGGTLVIQYNTNRRLKVDMTDLGPYPLQLSRDRVAVEEAPVRLLAPKHPALNSPNKITQKDFEGWVQERGLYFPNNWSDEYTALLSSNDPGEPARDGGLLVAQHGKGWFVYTGYSFFRELPAGVPGAYRLFVNLVSLGNE